MLGALINGRCTIDILPGGDESDIGPTLNQGNAHGIDQRL